MTTTQHADTPSRDAPATISGQALLDPSGETSACWGSLRCATRWTPSPSRRRSSRTSPTPTTCTGWWAGRWRPWPRSRCGCCYSTGATTYWASGWSTRENIYSVVLRTAEVLRPAVIESAPQIIVVHNHPTGNPEPSAQDIAVTRDIAQAGSLLGVELLDHVVIGGDRAVSLKDRGHVPG